MLLFPPHYFKIYLILYLLLPVRFRPFWAKASHARCPAPKRYWKLLFTQLEQNYTRPMDISWENKLSLITARHRFHPVQC